MKKIKTSLFLFAAALAVSLTAQAGSFSRGGGSFSRGSSSSSSPARSIGMTRPTYSAPTPAAPKYAAPAPTTSPRSYSAPTYRSTTTTNNTTIIRDRGGYGGGGGGGFMSSLAGGALGGVVGTMVGNALSTPHVAPAQAVMAAPAATAGALAPQAGAQAVGQQVADGAGAVAGVVGAAPLAVVRDAGPGFWTYLVYFLVAVAVLATLTGLTVLIIRRIIEWRAERRASEEMARLGITAQINYADAAHTCEAPRMNPFSPISRFIDIQRAFAARDLQTLRVHLSDDLYDQMVADLPPEGSLYTLAGISYVVEHSSRDLFSVRFKATDVSDGTNLDETWHWTRGSAGVWELAGVEQ